MLTGIFLEKEDCNDRIVNIHSRYYTVPPIPSVNIIVYKEIKSRAYKECSYWSRGKCLLYGMLLSPILGLVVHGSAYMIDQATGGSGLGAIYAYIGAALLAPIVMAVLGSIAVKKLHPIDAEVKEQITSIEETIRRS